jgi:hypothetical protein
MDPQRFDPDEGPLQPRRAWADSWRALLWAVVAMAGACAGPGTVPPKGASQTPVAPAPSRAQALVFGKFDLTRDGKEQAIGMRLAGSTTARALVLPEGSTRALALEVNEQGRFHWKLDPGTYTLLALAVSVGSETRTRSIDGRFSVAEGDAAVYIGHLKIDTGNVSPTGQLRDAQEDALPALRAQSPDLSARAGKRMLQPVERSGTYARVRSICSKDWGLECTRDLQGVAPLRPKLEHGLWGTGFTATDSLQPGLAWTPSPVDGTTYDVAIWEAVSYQFNALQARYLPGPLVVYQENLAQAEFVPNAALKPKSKYFWSVRLRRGDTVSNWSQAGHFTFLIVAWTSGSGEWFGFETP